MKDTLFVRNKVLFKKVMMRFFRNGHHFRIIKKHEILSLTTLPPQRSHPTNGDFKVGFTQI